MRTVLKFLKWQLLPMGIVCVEESGKLSWAEAFKRILSGGILRDPDGPTTLLRLRWEKMGRPLKRYKCWSCGVHFWSWRSRTACFRWRCIKRCG